jgi:hypothetical protein
LGSSPRGNSFFNVTHYCSLAPFAPIGRIFEKPADLRRIANQEE